ncbi:FUSC family protein [Kitasatospora sp. NPDC093679]|uniref:FUSC family protein n=1 Tax=Kitasatospora sp. NPDC093679 TaxID=3154983 RepID=UPI003446805C
MGSATVTPGLRLRSLPVREALRLGRPSDRWFKPALSVAAASALPNLVLCTLGRLDLVAYTMAGSLCALYGHDLPYARRATTLARVVLGMFAGVAVALTAASLTRSAVVLIAVGAVLAAVQKAVADASGIGPPGNVIFTFVMAGALFAPQEIGRVPGHLALTLAAGAFAWLVAMAPALRRADGPERRATARALTAAAAHAAAPGPQTRHAATTALRAARHCLRLAGAPTADRRTLHRLLRRAEATLAGPGPGPGPGHGSGPGGGSASEQLHAWAAAVRGHGPLPVPPTVHGRPETDLPEADLPDTHLPDAHPRDAAPQARVPRPRLLRSLAPGAAHAPAALRTLLGCALAGYATLLLGVDRPYWAIVTAASIHQANIVLTWNRTLQRTLGNLLGVAVFAAAVPLIRTGPVALVLCLLVLNFAAEALISRNYWLGTVAVTPMALLLVEFTGDHPAGRLIGDRVLDTLIGAAVGFAAALAVTNHRTTDRVRHALHATGRARAHAERTLADPAAEPAAVHAASRRLAHSLADLRDARDTAAGEWRRRTLPEQALRAAEEAGHRTLAETAQRRGGLHPAPESGAA